MNHDTPRSVDGPSRQPGATGSTPVATERIEFNKPSLFGNEVFYIVEAVRGGHLSGDGPFTKRCQRLLEDALGVPRVFLAPSCTHALELAALTLDLQPGDEVVMPSFTFVSTANAFALRGARPRFADVRPDTLNIDPRDVDARLTDRVKALVPVHYAGVGCEMDALGAMAAARGIALVEDNAHGLFGRWKERFLGTFGSLATLSFHETKNFTCGEGGALVVNDESLIERIEILREKGTNRSRFFRGQVDKYTWCDVGSSWLPSEVQAAFLLSQLEQRVEVMRIRRGLFETYMTLLRDWASDHGVTLPTVPPESESGYHMFHLLLPSERDRDALIRHLDARGITAVFHYVPLHLSPMGRRFGYRPGELPVTEDAAARLVRLPFFNTMTSLQQERVADAVREFVPEG